MGEQVPLNELVQWAGKVPVFSLDFSPRMVYSAGKARAFRGLHPWIWVA